MSEAVCEVPTFTECGPRWWCRPTLKVWQPRPAGVPAPPSDCASRPLCWVVRYTQGTRCSRLHRPIRLKPSLYHTARRALYGTVKVAGGGRSVHACAVFPSALNRVMGTISTKPRTALELYLHAP